MMVMLCRNRVADFAKWKAVFDSHIDDPNNVFFIFEVTDLEKARAFISTPEVTEAGQVSGVLDGEYYFLEAAPGD